MERTKVKIFKRFINCCNVQFPPNLLSQHPAISLDLLVINVNGTGKKQVGGRGGRGEWGRGALGKLDFDQSSQIIPLVYISQSMVEIQLITIWFITGPL